MLFRSSSVLRQGSTERQMNRSLAGERERERKKTSDGVEESRCSVLGHLRGLGQRRREGEGEVCLEGGHRAVRRGRGSRGG